MILQHIYSGNGVPNFTRIARVLWKILQKKHFGLFFSGHNVWSHKYSSTISTLFVFFRCVGAVVCSQRGISQLCQVAADAVPATI